MSFNSTRKVFYWIIVLIILAILVLLGLRYWKVTASINKSNKPSSISQQRNTKSVSNDDSEKSAKVNKTSEDKTSSSAIASDKTKNNKTNNLAKNSESKPSNNITTAKVQQATLEYYQDTIGVFYNYNQGILSSENSGIVEKVNADVGDYVKKGQVLATVNHTTLLNNKKRLEVKVSNLQTQLKNQRSTLSRSQELFKKGFLSQSELDATVLAEQNIRDQLDSAKIDLKDANISLDKSSVKSQVNGIVQDKKVTVGDLVNQGSVLFTIVNNDDLNIVASYPEAYLDMFKKNQKAIITLYNNTTINSLVKQVKPLINTSNRSIEVLIDIKNNKYNIKPGGTAKVSILVNTKNNALLIPEEAVVLRTSGLVAYVVKGQSVKEVPIKIGIHKGNNVEVLSGLKLGDIVAVSGAKYLDNNSLVNFQK